MEFLHEDKERFLDAINLTIYQTGISAEAIEKDYYVTMFLKILSKSLPFLVFKGGTSLSKCHQIIKRFSEDIDYTIVSFPVVSLAVNNYIGTMLQTEAPEFLKRYGLESFEMKVQSLDRTLADKTTYPKQNPPKCFCEPAEAFGGSDVSSSFLYASFYVQDIHQRFLQHP